LKEIQLTQGKVTVVDDEDYDILIAYRWYALNPYDNLWYAIRSAIHPIKGTKTTSRMHREIMRVTSTQEIDHINGDGLDNRRMNLRIVTRLRNQWNSRSEARSTSIYKGVSWDNTRSKWCAKIRVYGRLRHLGYFVDETMAAIAYDKAAKQNFGEYARLNFPAFSS
jgi:hypothetical protein